MLLLAPGRTSSQMSAVWLLSPRVSCMHGFSVSLKCCTLHASVERNPVQLTHLTKGTQDPSERRVGNPFWSLLTQFQRASLGIILTPKCPKSLMTHNMNYFLKQEIKMSLQPSDCKMKTSGARTCCSFTTFPLSSGLEEKVPVFFFK